MTERISPDQVRKVAQLAHLALREDEVSPLAEQLGEVLDYVERLRPVPTGGIPATAHPHDAACPLRRDDPAVDAGIEALQRNAPAVVDRLFVVPPVPGQDGR